MSEYLELAILPFQLPFMQYAFVITLMIACRWRCSPVFWC
ncbi:Chelated iron transport system membrane protein YfeD [Agrobacterium tumefaciens]|nr:Chelated iron transport system membrane protein YfeD [Agrobacterium tumefaciens]